METDVRGEVHTLERAGPRSAAEAGAAQTPENQRRSTPRSVLRGLSAGVVAALAAVSLMGCSTVTTPDDPTASTTSTPDAGIIEPSCPAQPLAALADRFATQGFSTEETGLAALLDVGIPTSLVEHVRVTCVVRAAAVDGRELFAGLVDGASTSGRDADRSFDDAGWSSTSLPAGDAFSAGYRYTSPDEARTAFLLRTPTLEFIALYGLDGPPYPLVFTAGSPEVTALFET